MADFKDLKAAFARVGFAVADDVLLKVARVLENPQGCESCGSPTKVGNIVGKTMTLACCNLKSKVG